MRMRFGKVMMPSRVIYSRWPKLFWRQLPLYQLVQSGLSIDQDLRHLIEVQVSTLNNCTFCADLHRADATLMKVTQAKLGAIDEYATHDIFNARELAALQYVTEITRDHHASDEAFEKLRSQFTEKEIIEITWLQAFTLWPWGPCGC
jgi:AhpD family alkylhydroperoxidase